MPTDEKAVYLTFDDGPHPEITSWVLDQLKEYHAAATFFCIGKNVESYPGTYQRIISEGHAVGNHTHQHLNGWRTKEKIYLQDISAATAFIQTDLFRPPYGRIRNSYIHGIAEAMHVPVARIIMWDVLSGDFDNGYSPAQCLNNVIANIGNGSIVVFHDSEKAFVNLKFTLPFTLEYLCKEGYALKKIDFGEGLK